MTERSGRCLCGAVRYRIFGEDLWSGHCHCESCRRQTASPFTTFFRVLNEDVEINREMMSTYCSSPGVARSFCKTCGSPMAFEKEKRPGQIDLYTATLDDHAGFEPTRHYRWEERVSWVVVGDNLPKEDGAA